MQLSPPELNLRRHRAALLRFAPLAAVICLTAQARAATKPVFQENFDGPVARWHEFNAASRWAVDADVPGGGNHAARIDATGEKSAIRSGLVNLKKASPTALVIAYRGMRKAPKPDARIGLDLEIVLDDGRQVWYLPPALELTAADRGKWTNKFATYVAPQGHRIAAFEVFCLNYDSDGPAWFDDIRVLAGKQVAAPGSVVVLSDSAAAGVPLGKALAAAGVTFQISPLYTDFSAARLVIVPQWREDEDLYFRLKVYHYLGGRLIVGALPDSKWAKALALYLWDRLPREMEDRPCLSSDGRALYVPQDGTVTSQAVQSLLATALRLPEEVAARDFGPKPVAHIENGCLYVGKNPLLFRAVGCYDLDPQVPFAEHSRIIAEYRRLGFNGLVLYLKWDFDPALLTRFLDLLQQQDMHVMIWMTGPPASPYSEKPLNDRWVLRLLQFRRHPAILGWILCDDTFDRYFPFVQRESQVFRKYDHSNVVTTTLIDLRHPDRVSKTDWAGWRRALDFPLTYLYPLQKGKSFGGFTDITGGLEDVQRLADNARSVWGPDTYIQQWCQAHIQTFAYGRVGLSSKETFVPSAEQQRLLTYMMLAAGTRGILYFGDFSLRDDRLGIGRRCELGLVWHELQPVAGVIAAGKWQRTPTGDPGLEAATYTRDQDTVLLLVHHAEGQNRCVTKAEDSAVMVTLPWSASAAPHIVRLSPAADPPVATVLPGGKLRVTVPAFDFAEGLLLTSNGEYANNVRARLAADAALDAQLSVAVLFDKRIKTETVCKHLPPLPPALQHTLAQADAQAEEAKTNLAKGDFDQAYRISRSDLLPYRSVQAQLMQQAEQSAQGKKLPADTMTKLNIFFSLPKFYQLSAGGAPITPGELRDEVLKRGSAVSLPGLVHL